MPVSRSHRVFMALLGLWLPFAFATHGVLQRCDMAMPASAHGMAGHEHGVPSDRSPGPDCSCHCLGSCHSVPLAAVPPIGAVTADRTALESRQVEPVTTPAGLRVDRRLPFATAPPAALQS